MDEFILGQKRRKDELELEERRHNLEMDKQDKDLEFTRMELDNAAKALDNSIKALEILQTISRFDERTRLQFRDHIMNILLSSSNPGQETPGISVYACIDQQEQAIGRPSTAPSTTRTRPSTRSRSRAIVSQSGP